MPRKKNLKWVVLHFKGGSLRWKNYSLFHFSVILPSFITTRIKCVKKGGLGQCLPSHTRSHSDSSEKVAFFSTTLRRGITRVFFPPLPVTLISDFPTSDNPCRQFSSSTSSASKSSKVKFNGRLLQVNLLRGIGN